MGQVVAQYIRYPKDPKWTFTTISNGDPVFDQSQPDYQDFELPLDDGNDLVSKILQYAGISIREETYLNLDKLKNRHKIKNNNYGIHKPRKILY